MYWYPTKNVFLGLENFFPNNFWNFVLDVLPFWCHGNLQNFILSFHLPVLYCSINIYYVKSLLNDFSNRNSKILQKKVSQKDKVDSQKDKLIWKTHVGAVKNIINDLIKEYLCSEIVEKKMLIYSNDIVKVNLLCKMF